MAAAGVPVAPGTTDPAADRRRRRWPRPPAIGYPVMVKAAAGGGGMGMARRRRRGRRCAPSTRRCAAFAERMFGDGSVLIERYFPRVRHVEVQILGLADGTRGRARRAGVLGAAAQPEAGRGVAVAGASTPSCGRGCSPRPCAPARRSATATPARSSACSTRTTGEFFFLEMNTRLQVEHPVTEAGATASTWSRSSCGSRPGWRRRSTRRRCAPRGHAIELRINAEDPKRFLPGPGAITDVGRADRRRGPGRLRLRRRHHGHPVLRLADGQADRARRRPGRGARAGPGRGRRRSRSSGRSATCRSSPSCWTTPSSSPATTTPASSGRMRSMSIGHGALPEPACRSARSGPRDGLQNEDPVPTDAKVRLLDALSRHRRRPHRGGQLRAPEGDPADGRRRRGVGGAPRRHPDVRYSALVPNSRGAQRALAAGFTRDRGGRLGLATPTTARNVNRSTDESLDDIAALIALLHDGRRHRRGDRRDQLRLPVRGRRRPGAGGGDRRPGGRRRRRPGRVRRHHRHGHPAAGARLVDRGPRPAPGRAAAAALPQHPGHRRWPTSSPRWSSGSPSSTRASAGSAAARTRRGRAATWPPRRWCTCCTTWASRPASTSRR